MWTQENLARLPCSQAEIQKSFTRTFYEKNQKLPVLRGKNSINYCMILIQLPGAVPLQLLSLVFRVLRIIREHGLKPTDN